MIHWCRHKLFSCVPNLNLIPISLDFKVLRNFKENLLIMKLLILIYPTMEKNSRIPLQSMIFYIIAHITMCWCCRETLNNYGLVFGEGRLEWRVGQFAETICWIGGKMVDLGILRRLSGSKDETPYFAIIVYLMSCAKLGSMFQDISSLTYTQ